MTIRKRPMSADGKTIERRRSSRFPVAVPLEVSWRGKDGAAMKVEAVARQVNANGGFLKMSSYPDAGTRVTLANFLSAQTAEARVLAGPPTREGVANGIIIELIEPSDTFWGVNLQVEKAAAELHKLEKAMQGEGIDLRLLKEYRDAVEFIRSAAAMVQQFRERHLRGLADAEPAGVLAADRIRRITNSCQALMLDIEAGHVKNESKEVDELYQALEHLSARLRRDCQKSGDRLLDDSHRVKRVDVISLGRSRR